MATNQNESTLEKEEPFIINKNDSEDNEKNVESKYPPSEDIVDTDSDSSEDPDDFLSFSEESEIYVLCQDDEAVCYFKNKDLATETMWKLARFNKEKFMNNFELFIKENTEESISVVGYHKFLVFSYERLFSTFSILPVKEVSTFKNEKNKNTEVKSDVDNLRARWW